MKDSSVFGPPRRVINQILIRHDYGSGRHLSFVLTLYVVSAGSEVYNWIGMVCGMHIGKV